MPSLHIITAPVAREIIEGSRPAIVERVRTTYLRHESGQSVNPPSCFLRFPEKPDARIIALPAYLGGDVNVAGIKWIASFPQNITRNVPRASAALFLNDYETGYPFACLEAGQISAARTAASAVLGAEALVGGRAVGRIALVGAGVIARAIVDFFGARQWTADEFVVHDRDPYSAQALANHIRTGHARPVTTVDALSKAIGGADVVVFATTAATPYLTDPGTFGPGQTVLNISLRDIGPSIIATAHNVLDDVDHCLTANTAPHLAEQELGHRDFVDGTLAQLLSGQITLGTDRPRIFSPFGLGVLDLSVALHVYQAAVAQGRATEIPDFFGEAQRWKP